MTQLKAMCNTCDAYTEFNRDGRCWRCMFEAAEKRAEDAEEREKAAGARHLEEEAALILRADQEATRFVEASQRAEDAIRERGEARAQVSVCLDAIGRDASELLKAESALAASQALTQRLRDKLQRTRDWLKFAADSEGGIVAEIDAALAESPDHVAPAPEGPLPGCTFIGGAAEEYARQLDEHIANGSWAAQEATASPAPEPMYVCNKCGYVGRTVMHDGCSYHAAYAPPPEEAAPQDSAVACSTCRLRRIGLPTPGYPHSPGCPEAAPQAQACECGFAMGMKGRCVCG